MSVFGKVVPTLLLGLWLACTTAWALNGKPQNELDQDTIPKLDEETSHNDASDEDGFCGLETAQRCAEKLQTAWHETDATRQLEELPFASMAKVKASLDSLNLKTRVLALTPTNREFIRRVKIGDIEANQPLLVDVETNHPDADFALTVWLNNQVRRRGFVFQEVPLEITLGAETVTASLKVGADFVE